MVQIAVAKFRTAMPSPTNMALHSGVLVERFVRISGENLREREREQPETTKQSIEPSPGWMHADREKDINDQEEQRSPGTLHRTTEYCRKAKALQKTPAHAGLMVEAAAGPRLDSSLVYQAGPYLRSRDLGGNATAQLRLARFAWPIRLAAESRCSDSLVQWG